MRSPVLSSTVGAAGVPDVSYKIANDQTLWMLTMAAGPTPATWVKLPSVPNPNLGATIVSFNASKAVGRYDTIYCDMSDGTSWMCTVGSPPIWSQLTTIPQT